MVLPTSQLVVNPSSHNPEDLVQQMTAAVAGLSWTSETDAPFDVLLWTGMARDGPTAADVLHRAQLPPETPAEAIALESFLAPATEIQDWYGPDEIQMAERFQALQAFLEQTLTQIRVYRCGTIEREIYIVGQTQDLDWLALHTTAVET
ncbi:nuclease A inhibitor family protein [Altericista sp. CCNU0014]|uniref:nuclease A inhibitor family protein n=1 Tax=Altericista sp. CCNU0014 TaxID=3082949 RepID=UPI00384C7AD9